MAESLFSTSDKSSISGSSRIQSVPVGCFADMRGTNWKYRQYRSQRYMPDNCSIATVFNSHQQQTNVHFNGAHRLGELRYVAARPGCAMRMYPILQLIKHAYGRFHLYKVGTIVLALLWDTTCRWVSVVQHQQVRNGGIDTSQLSNR